MISLPTDALLRRFLVVLAIGCIGALSSYGLLSYGLIPSLWKAVERRHPALSSGTTCTVTKEGIPGDPLNIAVVGTEEALLQAMHRAQWNPADPITLASSLRIAADSALRRAYDEAPVSNLFLWSKRQDLAFERPAGADPRTRHHVRFWRSAQPDSSTGRPFWMGAATFDTSVGVSHRTGQVTHHIAADVDSERDQLLDALRRSSAASVQWVEEFQPAGSGTNGAGDRYFTDRKLPVIELDADGPKPAGN